MHGEPALGPDFKAFPYVNPDAPKGGTLVQGALGTFDSLNPLIVKGVPAISLRSYVVESLLTRGYDEPFTLYGLLAETVETDAARSYVTFRLDPRARFSDGKPVTAEDVIFSWQLLARPRPAELPQLLRQGRQGRGARRAHRALRPLRQRRPRIAADPRPDAGAAQARRQPGHVRGDDAQADRRQRPLCRRAGRCRAQRDAAAQSGLLGARSRGQPRPVEFRHPAVRLLPRHQRATGGVQARPVRRARRDRSGALADRLRLSRGARRSRRQGRAADRPAQGHLRLRVQHPPRRLRRRPRARGDLAPVRLRMDQQELLLRPLPPLGELFRRQRAVRLSAARPTRASAPCSRRFPTACAPTSSTAPGRRR